ncbi:MAG: uracil phosphoribosyltransferase [Cytophagales bacterium]|nr:uracil phosphoribosyltransferase [Cytophagales bacterium]
MFVLNKTNSIANHFLAEIRDQHIQKDSMRFRKNLERLGGLLAYEISKSLSYQPQPVTTPLGISHVNLLENQPVLIPIMRAGIPFYLGVLNYFDGAVSGFIGAYRHHAIGNDDFEIQMDYVATPSLKDRRVILIDPMLATGKSIVKTLKALRKNGEPQHIDIMCVIAAPEGIDFLHEHIDLKFNLWVAAVDEKLNDRAYIIPGLGDAGDLAYGHKS